MVKALQHANAAGSWSALRVLSLVAVVVAYLLLVLGDTVRVTDSGMGCASWPLCNGHVGLYGSYHAMLEQSHRYLAAILSVLVLATLGLVLRLGEPKGRLFVAAISSTGLLGLQVLLGAITVFAHNAGWTVALHLAGAWLLVASIVVVAMTAWDPAHGTQNPAPTWVDIAARGSAAILFGVAVTGMVVLHDGASRACPTWPACTDQAPLAQVAMQYAHRLFVGLAAIATLSTAVLFWRRPGARMFDRALAVLSTLLLISTAIAGALVATTGAGPLPEAVHLALASGLWMAVVVMASRHAPWVSSEVAKIRPGEPVVARKN